MLLVELLALRRVAVKAVNGVVEERGVFLGVLLGCVLGGSGVVVTASTVCSATTIRGSSALAVASLLLLATFAAIASLLTTLVTVATLLAALIAVDALLATFIAVSTLVSVAARTIGGASLSVSKRLEAYQLML